MNTNNRVIENIVKPLASIFVVGMFLIGLVGANEVIETFKAKENYQLANYNAIPSYLMAFSNYELDEQTDTQVLQLMCGIADEVNANNNDNVAVGVYSKSYDIFVSNNDDDLLLNELIHSIEPGSRKIKGNLDYFNSEYGNYRFIMAINHEGIFNILLNNGVYKKLFISSAIFAFLSITLIIVLQNDKNIKYRRILGIIFIFIWIGSITLTSAIDLNRQQRDIVKQEVEHVTSLIEFYYRQDLIEHGDEIEDRRQFALDNISNFINEDGNILNIELNENYHDDLDQLDGCLTVTVNEKNQKNKRLEFILSAILFLVLAIILYDKLSERIMIDNVDQDDNLTKLDSKIITLELINITGNCLTWSLLLPRLMEVARLNFSNNGSNYVSSIYSAGVIITTISSLLSSRINKLFRNVKTYFIFTFIFDLIGITGFALIDNFAYNFIAYFMICLADGMSGMLIYFYVAGCLDSQRKENILVKCRSTLSIGQSIGIIVGGVFGSIFKYSTVLLIAAVIIFISTILLFLTNSKEYDKAEIIQQNNPQSIKSLLSKKQSFLFLIFIIVPLAFYDVYLDYKFPIDIINLGLTTVVISFVSMSGRLISAYASNITYPKLRKKVGLNNMTFIYLIGCIVLMLVNQISTSILMIIIVTAAMGLLDSFGTLSYRERFIEISSDENINEDDGNVLVKVGDKLGTSIGPSLISLCNNAIIIPLTMGASFIIYKLMNRKK